MQERGLKPEAIERFRLGFVDDPLPGHEHMRGRISIPYLAPDGSVGTIRFRAPGGSGGKKYLSMANDPPRLFNTSALEAPVTGLFVTEGELDAITVSMLDFPAVGVPGATAWNPVWRWVFAQYSVIYVLHDDDDPGKDLADTICAQLDSARPIPMTGGDVNSCYLEMGADGLKTRILA